MKIALSFPGCNRRGGVERIIYECARYLAGKGHEVTVYANEFDKSKVAFNYRRISMRAPLRFLQPFAYFMRCTSALDLSRYSAVGTFGCVCPKGGVYWAQSVHAAWLDKAKAFRPLWSLARWKQQFNPMHPMLILMEKWHFRRGSYRKIIALTDDVKADLQHYYGVPENDIVVIPNGYAPEEFNLKRASGQRAEMRAKLGFTDQNRVIAFVSNELDRKGYPALLQAVESLKDPDLRVLVAGKQAPAPHPLVHYAGSSGDVASLYAASDVFALPTRYEAWGLVIVEALACGLPVLTTRLAGAAVTVQEGVTGELVDEASDVAEIAEKLKRLLDGHHAAKEEIAASVASYAWSEVLVKYEQLLDETNPRKKLMAQYA